jgi:Fibronectin type III domain
LIKAFSLRLLIFLILTLVAFIAGETNATTVTLVWNANPEPDIAGYRVYYGTAAAPFGNLVDVGSPTAAITDLETGVTYTFAVTAYNTAGAESAYSQPVSYTGGSSRVIPQAVLHNVSDRAFVQTGEDVMIGGFIVDGIVGKKVALRALGPSLASAGVSQALADPFLQIVDSSGAVVVSNDNWNVPGQELSAFGLAPTDAREAGLVTTMQPGAYSAIVSGQGASIGVALFELYDLDAGIGRVVNVSTRSRIEPGDKVLIGGFIIGGTAGTPVIIRAIGPSLIANGVADAMLDPRMDIYDGNGTLMVSNDNWRTDQESSIVETGLPPADDREAAIVSTLAPGAYSAVIQGATGGSGVALFEIYALNQ